MPPIIFDGNGKLAFVDTGKNSKDGKHLYYCAGEMD
jgi:hypothetical protein